MDPPNLNDVPPIEDITSLTEQLKGHGFSDKEIGAILTLAPSTYVPESPNHIHRDERPHEPFLKRGTEPDSDDASSSKRTKLYNFENTSDPKGKKPLTHDYNSVIINDIDDHHQRKEIPKAENQIPLAFDINAYNINIESETDDSDNDDFEDWRNESFIRSQYKLFNKDTAKRFASRIHSVSENKEKDDDVEHEIDDGSPTPFSKAIKAIQERVTKSNKRGFVDESLTWESKLNGEDCVRRRLCVPSLQEMSLKILANHADGIASLDCVSDALKQRLSALLCDSRKMNAHSLELLLSGFPNVIRLKDCSWMTEEEYTKYFGKLDNSILEVCLLNLIVSHI